MTIQESTDADRWGNPQPEVVLVELPAGYYELPSYETLPNGDLLLKPSGLIFGVE